MFTNKGDARFNGGGLDKDTDPLLRGDLREPRKLSWIEIRRRD